MNFILEGNVVDIRNEKIFAAAIHVVNGTIASIEEKQNTTSGSFILPGFIDAHVHIESSMLVPAEFARLAVVHGTVATVSDPHEIANVCGAKGVEFMIENGNTVPFKFYFGAPSCVPATSFENAGAVLDSDEVEKLLRKPEIKYLSEMMNFPGVLNNDGDIMKKIAAAKTMNKPVDGHAPGLTGEDVKKYIAAGISTDHECFTKEEAEVKLKNGMKIIIREGSAAKNFEALIELLEVYPDDIMFCSDDKHPDSLVSAHIDQLCARAIKKGINLFHVLGAACINPVLHYGLDVGLLKPGDPADFIVVEDLESFNVRQTYISGQLVAEHGSSKITTSPPNIINHFSCNPITEADIEHQWNGSNMLPAIEAVDGQLITNRVFVHPLVVNNQVVSDPASDILKIIVVNRYSPAAPAVALIKNFGLKRGAIASSVAHDSHNIVAVGADDANLCQAVNLLIQSKGGISVSSAERELVLPLPIAGLMSVEDGYTVAENYSTLDAAAKELGSTLAAPFMTLSFMALLVIPHLKISDMGLFDGDSFSFMK